MILRTKYSPVISVFLALASFHPALADHVQDMSLDKLSLRIEKLITHTYYVEPPKDRKERESITAQLNRFSVTEAIALVPHFDTYSASVRAFILQTFSLNFKGKKEWFNALEKQFNRKSNPNERALLCSLCKIVDYKRSIPLLTKALSDQATDVRYAAVTSLMGSKLSPALLKQMTVILKTDPASSVRERAVFAVSESGAREAADILSKCYELEADGHVKQSIASALRELKRLEAGSSQ